MKAVLTALLAIVASVLFSSPAYAADVAQGQQVFAANCIACHSGGLNAVMPPKTLKQDALEQNLAGYGTEHSVDAIVTQVTNGKSAMPAFGGRLTDAQIADVAAYVKSQADSGWAG